MGCVKLCVVIGGLCGVVFGVVVCVVVVSLLRCKVGVWGGVVCCILFGDWGAWWWCFACVAYVLGAL